MQFCCPPLTSSERSQNLSQRLHVKTLNATVGADLMTLRSGHSQRHAETKQERWLAPAYCMQLYAGRHIQSSPTLQVPIQAIGREGSGVGESCNPMRSVFPMFLFLPFPIPCVHSPRPSLLVQRPATPSFPLQRDCNQSLQRSLPTIYTPCSSGSKCPISQS